MEIVTISVASCSPRRNCARSSFDDLLTRNLGQEVEAHHILRRLDTLHIEFTFRTRDLRNKGIRAAGNRRVLLITGSFNYLRESSPQVVLVKYSQLLGIILLHHNLTLTRR